MGCWAWLVMIFGLLLMGHRSVREFAPLQCCGYNKPMIRVMCEPQSPPWVTKLRQPHLICGRGANLPYFS